MPEESLDRFKVADEDKIKWGQLVKDWAKGLQDKPRTLDELREQCRQRRMTGVHIPDYMTGLVFVQNDRHVLTVRLPPKELIEAGEESLSQPGAPYPLPTFYDRFGAEPGPDATERVELQAARIGEYAVNSCG